jgi:hypothetical protein
MFKRSSSSDYYSRRKSTALSSLSGSTKEGQVAGKEALAGLLDFLASPSPPASGSFTPTIELSPHGTPTTGCAPSSPSSLHKSQKEKTTKKEKKTKEKNESEGSAKRDKSETSKREKGMRSSDAAAKKASAMDTASPQRLPDQLLMTAMLEKEKAAWERELRGETSSTSGSKSADMERGKKKERRLSFTLRRRSSSLQAIVEPAAPPWPVGNLYHSTPVPIRLDPKLCLVACTVAPQDAFFIEGCGQPAPLASESRVYKSSKSKTLRVQHSPPSL